ncbi:MAG: CopG family transcriptional regulator [Nanoarchaeota archaeon]|nr:CopG family transcriptional regulator [Nanoarchaeota archaeon]
MEVNLLTDSNETVLKIPEELSKELKIRAEDKGFKSLQDYVTYILRQVLSKIEMDEKQKKEPSTKEGEEEIKQKLRDLGYLE